MIIVRIAVSANSTVRIRATRADAHDFVFVIEIEIANSIFNTNFHCRGEIEPSSISVG